jgi:tetratricopeptide (TPR) repeat protein
MAAPWLFLSQMKIFLSYRWDDTADIDKIDNDFKAIGIELTRDIRDLHYKDSLPGFMAQITESDYALLYISDGYLRSENCMFEAITLFHGENFQKQVLPIFADGANVFDPALAIELLSYWDKKLQDLNSKARSLPDHLVSATVNDRLSKLKFIRDNVDAFVKAITEMLGVRFNEAKASGYRVILEHIGYENKDAIAETLQVLQNPDSEQQLITLRELREKHRTLLEIDLIESHVHFLRGDVDLARRILQNRQRELPDNHLIHNNLGFISDSIGDLAGAESEYSAAVLAKPDFGEGYYNLAHLSTLSMAGLMKLGRTMRRL